MDHYNRLDPEVAELLAILAEECGEITQRVGKILRHGFRKDPYTGRDNTETLQEELADLQAIVGLLAQLNVLSTERIRDLSLMKLNKLRRPDILHHSTLLRPNACVHCGSKERIQRGYDGSEYWVECVDREACDLDMRKTLDEELARVSQAILSGDAW